eukprot:15451135-Alexandrium_andersonii.AAC.1
MSGGYFVDVINTLMVRDIDEGNAAGTGLVLPADDVISARLRRVPPPMPPRLTGNQADLEAFKAWRLTKLGECFRMWSDVQCMCAPL